MKGLRVVHLVHDYPPEFTGGTERYLSDLVALQKEAGLQVSIICGSELRDDAVAAVDATWRGVEVRRVFRRHDELFGVEFLPRRTMGEVTREVRARAPDLVHLHHWLNLGDEVLAALAPLPAVASFHDAYAGCPRVFFLRPDGFFCGGALPVPVERCVECLEPDDGLPRLRERVVARRERFEREIGRLAAALAPSEYHADLLVRAGVVPREKVRALPLGIARAPQRAVHKSNPGKLRLVTFGHLSRLKGLDLVLEAMRPLAARGGIELHCYGSPLGKETAPLRAAAAGLPVTWHGDYDLDALALAAAELDLALFPSRAHETYSLVLEEAIALGLPVIVSDRGAPPRRIGAVGRDDSSGSFGRAVAVEDSSALRATLAELMDHPERLDAMRRALPAAPHLLADHERALREIYAEAIASGPGARA